MVAQRGGRGLNPPPASTTRARAVAGYDRLARVYRWLEWPVFRRGLQQARTSLLGELPTADRILVLGDGDGRLLEALHRAQPRAEFVSVDQSPGMLEQQRRRLRGGAGEASGRVTWVCADLLKHCPEPGGFDLLVTAFFVDCFDEPELRRGLPVWLASLRPGGHWLMVDFVEPASGWHRWRARFWLAWMHAFFRFQTGCPNRRLVDWRAIPTGRERRRVAHRDAAGGMIRSELFGLA